MRTPTFQTHAHPSHPLTYTTPGHTFPPPFPGLQAAVDLIEPIKQRHPSVSYADLYQMASAVAVEVRERPRHTPPCIDVLYDMLLSCCSQHGIFMFLACYAVSEQTTPKTLLKHACLTCPLAALPAQA